MRVVTNGHWSVSYTTDWGLSPVRLNVRRHYDDVPNQWGGHGVSRRGDHDGRTFPSIEAAERFALERGYLQPWCRAVRFHGDMEAVREWCASQRRYRLSLGWRA